MSQAFTFYKMTGAGNDFVCIDNRKGNVRLTKKKIAALCDRHFGVGGDGLLLLETINRKDVDFRMKYYNADGGPADMCGNGARCFANFARQCRAVSPKKKGIRFMTLAGVIEADYLTGGQVRITLTEPEDQRLHIPLKTKTGGKLEAHFLNTGVPHVVVYKKDLEKLCVKTLGSEIRWHKAFAPAGANVNLVELTGKSSIRVRTYERGVEDETLACGTGVTAAALISHLVHSINSPVSVKVQGGPTLKVGFKKTATGFEQVTLTGPATYCYKGMIEV
ncbi:MAG: diaminopimelate epimerase [Verrucomicrobiota bacterium]